MTALVLVLAWLPQVLSAMSLLPQPVNLNLTSVHFCHVLRWEPGPGTPTGVSYRVSMITQKAASWVSVTGCKQVQHPLVCNLTQAFSNPNDVYRYGVTAFLDSQDSEPVTSHPFQPIKDTFLDLPRLTVTSCGRNLCVDFHPPMEHLREIYESLHYKLSIKYNNMVTTQDAKFLRRAILENLAPGSQYCISVCFSDSMVPRMSNYSSPVCTSTPGNRNADVLISALVCSLMMAGVAFVALLVPAGYINLRRRPLPLVLATIHHMDGVLVVAPRSPSLSSLLNVNAMPPSSGEKGSRQTLSEESDEEGETESTGGSGGGVYKLRVTTNLLSSSSSSSSSLAASLSPEPEPAPSLSSNQTSDQDDPRPAAAPRPAETGSCAGRDDMLASRSGYGPESRRRALDPPEDSDCVTGGRIEEEEEEEEVGDGGSQDVNLLTLTFGRQEEEVTSHEPSSAEDSTPILPTETCDTEEVLETVSCSVEEEEEEECGYIGRPCTRVLQNVL